MRKTQVQHRNYFLFLLVLYSLLQISLEYKNRFCWSVRVRTWWVTLSFISKVLIILCVHACVCMFVVLRVKGSSEPDSSSIFQGYIGDLVCFFICVFSLCTPQSFLMPFVLQKC